MKVKKSILSPVAKRKKYLENEYVKGLKYLLYSPIYNLDTMVHRC